MVFYQDGSLLIRSMEPRDAQVLTDGVPKKLPDVEPADPADLAAALQGAVVKDEDKDKVYWKEYLENVMKKRGSAWLPLYRACRELNG